MEPTVLTNARLFVINLIGVTCSYAPLVEFTTIVTHRWVAFETFFSRFTIKKNERTDVKFEKIVHRNPKKYFLSSDIQRMKKFLLENFGFA